MLEKYNKDGTLVKLLEDIDIRYENVSLTANTGYELVYNHSKRLNDTLLLCCCIKKTNGYFNSNDDTVLAFNGITCKGATMSCGLGGHTDWNVEAVGYCFISTYAVIVSDKLSRGVYNRAYINLIVPIA